MEYKKKKLRVKIENLKWNTKPLFPIYEYYSLDQIKSDSLINHVIDIRS